MNTDDEGQADEARRTLTGLVGTIDQQSAGVINALKELQNVGGDVEAFIRDTPGSALVVKLILARDAQLSDEEILEFKSRYLDAIDDDAASDSDE